MKQLGQVCYLLVGPLEDVEDTEEEQEDSALLLEDPLVLEVHFGEGVEAVGSL